MTPLWQFLLALVSGGVGAKLIDRVLDKWIHARREEMDAEQHARDELWKELASVRMEVKELRTQVVQLQNDRLSLIAERDALKLRIVRLEEDLAGASLEIARLRSRPRTASSGSIPAVRSSRSPGPPSSGV